MKLLKIKTILISLILMWVYSPLFSDSPIRLTEVMTPSSMIAEGIQLYIAEYDTVLLYNLKNFKFLKKFGQKGEGPSEFSSFPMLKVYPEQLIINCFGKFMRFSRSGDFISEKRTTMAEQLIYPVGVNYVAIKVHQSRETGIFYAIALYDINMKPIKEITRETKGRKTRLSSGKVRMEVPREYFGHEVYGDKVFIGDTGKGFFIGVFNSKGDKLYEINKKFDRLKVTDEYKERHAKRMKGSGGSFFKNMANFVFKDYFPAFEFFKVNDGKIYVFTYKRKAEKRELIVMDLTGKILKTVFVTQVNRHLQTIANDRLYFLKDNLDDEVWELFVEDL